MRYPTDVHRVFAVTLAVTAGCFTKPTAPARSDGGTSAGDAGDAGDAAPGTWLTGYLYRRSITVNRPLQPDEKLAKFPLSIVLDDDGSFADHVQSAADVTFTAGDGITELPFEVVSFDEAQGDLEAWVLTDTLPPGMSQLYLYYAGGVRVSQPSVVWAQAGGAWHMAGRGLSEQDSAGKVMDVTTPGNSTAPIPVQGVLGSSRYYDGDDYLCTPTSGALPIVGSTFSVSLWAAAEGVPNDAYDSPFSRGGNESNAGVTIELGSGSWNAIVRDDKGLNLELGFNAVGGTATLYNQFVLTVDSVGAAVVYSNGNRGASGTAPGLGPFSDDHPTCVGGVAHKFKGRVDEVRFYNHVLSDAWVQAEYLNLSPATRASFVSIGAEETP